MHCTALGKALLSYLPYEQISSIFQNYEYHQFTPKTTLNFKKLLENLHLSRKQGYALDEEEHELGVICYGATIINHGNTPLAAMSISTPKERFSAEQRRITIEVLVNSARKFSKLIRDFPSNEMSL